MELPIITKVEDARKADPSKYKMTKEMYRLGLSWLNRLEEEKEEFYDFFGESWESVCNTWDDRYVRGEWNLDIAVYILDFLESSRFPNKGFWPTKNVIYIPLFPILELKEK